MGVDEVSLDLLEHQKQHNEPQRLPRVVYQHQQRAHRAADECAHNGDQRRQGDQHAYKQGIGEAENGHGEDEHSSQNHGFQTLAGQEIGEGFFAETQDVQHLIRRSLRQERIAQLAALPGQLFLLQQDIQGKDEPDEKRGHAADNPADQSAAGNEQPSAPALSQLDRFFGKALPVDGQAFDLFRQGRQIFLKPDGAFL